MGAERVEEVVIRYRSFADAEAWGMQRMYASKTTGR